MESLDTPPDEPISVLSLDLMKDLGVESARVHFTSPNGDWTSSNSIPLSALGLLEETDIFGAPLPASDATNPNTSWVFLDCTCMIDVLSKVESLSTKKERENDDSKLTRQFSGLLAAIPSDAAHLATPTRSMVTALFSKYMASQELDTIPNTKFIDHIPLSSSPSSSWSSDMPPAALNEGIQVIGAMGGKSIEFHRPKFQVGDSHPLSGLLQEYPHISLYNMAVDNFSADHLPEPSLEGLKSLDLSSNFASSWRQHIAPILKASPTIETFNLSSNPIQNLDSMAARRRTHHLELATRALSWLNSSSENAHHCVHFFKTNWMEQEMERNQLEVPSAIFLERDLFSPAPSLTTLVLNKTGISWPTFVMLTSSLPALTEAHVCLNHWTSLSPAKIQADTRLLGSNSLEILNLDSNMLSDFGNVAEALSTFPNLSKLVLSNNLFSDIPNSLQLDESHPFSRKPTEHTAAKPWSISLSSSRFEKWSSLRKLASLIPELTEIRWQRNKMLPLSSMSLSNSSSPSEPSQTPTGPAFVSDQVCRHYVVAMCPKVTIVNGSPIAMSERRDSERLFLVHLFTSLSKSRLPATLPADLAPLIDEFSQDDETLKRLWTTQRAMTMEAFQRAFPTTSGAGSSLFHTDGISMMDVTIASESTDIMITKRLPASTSVARLRAIITASFTSPQQRKDYHNFQLFLMETNFMGPPSFYPLTSDQTTLAQETTKLKVGLLIKPQS